MAVNLSIKTSIFNIFFSYLFGISLFITSLPYFVWDNPLFRYIFQIIIVLLSVINLQKRNSNSRYILMGILLCILFYKSIGSSVFTLLSLLSLVFIYLIEDERKLIFYNAGKKIFAIMFLFSLIVYFLTYWLSVDISYHLATPLNSMKDGGYRIYPFLAVYDSSFRFADVRFAGYFDEPGVMGTLSGMFLYCEKYNLRKWENIIFFIAGIMSFSFFFLFSSFLFFLVSRPKSKIFIFILMILGILLFCFKDTEIVKTLVLDRWQVTSSGQFGGTRSFESFETHYQKMLYSPAVFWGKGTNSLVSIMDGSSTYKSLIYAHGILWFGVMLLFFCLFALLLIKNHKKNLILYILFFGGLIYQRPGIFNAVFFFLLIVMPQKLSQCNE